MVWEMIDDGSWRHAIDIPMVASVACEMLVRLTDLYGARFAVCPVHTTPHVDH